MILNNNLETEKTIAYLRDLADKLESDRVHLSEVTIESRNVCWQIEEETLTIQVLKVVDNG